MRTVLKSAQHPQTRNCGALAASLLLLSSVAAGALQTGSIPDSKRPAINLQQTYGEVGVSEQDLNFDGLPDMVITKLDETDYNPTFVYFIYDPEKKGFRKNIQLARLTFPTFHSETKTVRTLRRGTNNQQITEIYIWDNGELKLQDQTIRSLNETDCSNANFALEPSFKRQIPEEYC